MSIVPPPSQTLPSATMPIRLSAGHPWRALAPGVDWDSPLLHRPLTDIFDHSAVSFPERPYLAFMGRQWTYGDSALIIERAAIGLQQIGVRQGVRVGLCLPNTPYAPWAYFAVLKAGGTVVPLNPQQSDHELFQQLGDTECRVLITLNLQQMLPRMDRVAPDCVKTIISCPMAGILPPLRKLFFTTFQRSHHSPLPDDPRHLSWDEMLASLDSATSLDIPGISPDQDVAVILHTTGGSGLPKAVMLSHSALSVNTEQLRRWFHPCVPGEERFLAILPFFHSLGMTAVQNLATVLGAELVLLPRFDLDHCLRTISKTRPTVMVGIPGMYGAITTCNELEAYDLSSLRYAVCGGGILPLSVQETFESISGCRMIEGYGLTEAGPVTHCMPLVGPQRHGAIGLPLPGTEAQIRAPGPSSQSLRSGSIGELWVRGPQLMSGYWHRPEETRTVLRDGWLQTGDSAWQDEEGYLHFVGRSSDSFHVFDTIFYPQQIEAALLKHPMVIEAACLRASPDNEDPRPFCFVALHDSHRPDEIPDTIDLQAFLRDILPSSTLPQAIEIWGKLPRTSNGKISRQALEDYLRKNRDAPP